MTTDTSSKIISYIQERKQATPHELVDFLHISKQALFRQLKNLVVQGRLVKIGQPPKVFYMLPTDTQEWSSYSATAQLTPKQMRIIDERYLYVSPFGQMVEGVGGFMHWCKKTKQPIEKTAAEYLRTLQKYDRMRKDGFLDGTTKLQQTFDTVYLDRLCYIDFYSIERFGKTKLGQLLLYAKQSQQRQLMQQVSTIALPFVKRIIELHHIDAVGFIPPTVKREVQFMDKFSEQLHLQLPTISITKVTSDIPVPQKTLTKVEDRIENAKRTIVADERQRHRNILLIDDAVGSGATLNETAKKIREQKLATGSIIGLSITGSYKGFDVISEV